jgi:hypothetical protein
MGRGSFNGGGTFWVAADFGTNEEGGPSPTWRSKYMREFSEIKFAQNLLAILSTRRIALQELIKQDETVASELERVELFLSDLNTYFDDAKAYVLGARLMLSEAMAFLERKKPGR